MDEMIGFIDESWIYPGSLIVLAILAFMQWQINATKTLIVVLLLMVYIVYSHESGNSFNDLRKKGVEAFDKAIE